MGLYSQDEEDKNVLFDSDPN